MSILLLLLLLTPASLNATGQQINCEEIRKVLVEGVYDGVFEWRDVDSIYRRCVRRNERSRNL